MENMAIPRSDKYQKSLFNQARGKEAHQKVAG